MRITKSFILAAGLAVAGLVGCEEEQSYTTTPLPPAAATQPAPIVSAPVAPIAPLMMESKSESDGKAQRWVGEGISWEVPAGWVQKPASPMRIATLAATKDGASVDFAVSQLKGDAGGLLANVNRWRGQIGLPLIGEGELKDKLRDVDVDGVKAQIYDEKNAGKRAVAAIVPHEGDTYFIKALADDAAIEPHMSAFETFVKSIRFQK